MSSRNPSLARLRSEFEELSTVSRITLVAGVVVEVTAKVSAWVDLYRRPAAKIRGPKWVWAAAQFINGFGPAAYWSFGRK